MCGVRGELDDVKKYLLDKYRMKDLGPTEHLLGVNVDYDMKAGTLKLRQTATVVGLLDRFGMTYASPSRTPARTQRLTKRPIDQSSEERQRENAKLTAEWGSAWASLYRVLIGSLIWLSVSTRPDISFAVVACAMYVADPTAAHFAAAKYILRYLCGTKDYGLLYRRSITTKCAAYSDADFAGDEDTRRSTTGTVIMICGCALMWRSKRQKIVTLSTCEAELVALCDTMKDAKWILELLGNIGMKPEGAFVVHEDNAAALIVAESGRRKARTKHFDIRYFWITEKIKDKTFRLMACPSEDMLADIFTKPTCVVVFLKLRTLIGVVDLGAQS
jgi:hypothetical protein